MTSVETAPGSFHTPRDITQGAGDSLCVVLLASPVRALIGTILPVREPVVIQRLTFDDLQDTQMSRSHATVAPSGLGLTLRDGAAKGDGWARSSNGTFATGERLGDGAIRIADRGTFRTGRSLWMVVRNPAPPDEESLLVGVSGAIGRARDEIQLVVKQVSSRLEAGERVTQALLVTGPRGSGKQVVAREAHRLLSAAMAPKKVPFRQVSAPTLADGTGAADLFGVVDKYATDVAARSGIFAQSHGGILLLDEVADTPLSEQAKLLNVLQEREVTPLGGRKSEPFDCLVVAATNKPLEGEHLREDLVDRLTRFHVTLPPLRERPEDIPVLARALLTRHKHNGDLSPSLAEKLVARWWAGNVRALDAVMERLAALAATPDERLGLELADRAFAVLVDAEEVEQAEPALPPRARPTSEVLQKQLDETGWNKSEVARRYGRDPRQIRRWIVQYGLVEPSA